MNILVILMIFWLKLPCGLIGRLISSQHSGKHASLKCWLLPTSPYGELTRKNIIRMITFMKVLNLTSLLLSVSLWALSLAARVVTYWNLYFAGQVVNIVRESACTCAQTQGWVVTQHVTIPAAYSSGIVLVIRRESPGYEELRSAPELPLLQQQH